ncbi:hypothetical protein QIS74_04934 [Colletotrichum tabaci]|uniref:Uncharacterized protein n=1 Tax=Colletotrichum tabaci TaxID=1209068 RepID=A0AAV9TL06_9PEZI
MGNQVAHVYANPGIAIPDVPATWAKLKSCWWFHARQRDHSQWDLSSFLCSQLSDDEVGNVARVVFAPERTWYQSAASVECRKRFDAVKSNLGYQSVEHVFLVFGLAIAKSWTALKNINFLANVKDKAKRKTDAEIRAAITNPQFCNQLASSSLWPLSAEILDALRRRHSLRLYQQDMMKMKVRVLVRLKLITADWREKVCKRERKRIR